jgi:tetratricopeptide (TPR) repeat protein
VSPGDQAGGPEPVNNQNQQRAFQRALNSLQNGNAAEAEALCSEALLEFPEDPNFLCLSARALTMLQRYAQAEERANNAMTLFPEFPRAYVVRGELRLLQGRGDQAAGDFRRAVELGDEDPNTRVKLGRALAMQGDREAAEEAVRESLDLDPVRSKLAEAFRLQSTGNEAEAERIYRRVLKDDPENVDALRLLAGLATGKRFHRDAETLLRRAIELSPDYGRALADLVINLVEQDRADEACEWGEKLLRVGADNANTHLVIGNALSAAGRYDEAIQSYRRTLKKSPEQLGALSGLAHNLKTIGRQDEAVEMYRRCLEINPYFVDTYWNLANLNTFRFTDEEVGSMEKLLEHPNIPDESQVFLHNALGFARESDGDYDRAFGHFSSGNAVKRQMEYYDSVNTEFLFDRIIEEFDADRLAGQSPATDSEATPIFIVGLPRSGSTLLEQILASHSAVEGTHELSELTRVVNELPRKQRNHKSFPETVAEFDAADFLQLGEEYLQRTRKYRSGAPFFTDKNPNNFSNIGLIHLALPNAVVIDARRHPLDSCFGCFKQLFARGQTFSYDLVDIGEYYLEYRRLMDHWHSVLPGKVLEVHYEDVVADLEPQVRRILEHCGLPFEEECLRYHETDRAVKTASSEQVRQPIYRSSVNLWRNYEKHLDPLIEILEPILRELPASDRPQLLQKARK